jgi:hypothetical protein
VPVKSALLKLYPKHLFQTNSLGAKLKFLVSALSMLSRLVLDRIRGITVELHDIRPAGKVQPLGPDRQGPLHSHARFGARSRLIHALMHIASAHGVNVLVPDVLKVDQRALARAVAVVLQGGDHDRL